MIEIEYNKINGLDLFNCLVPFSIKENDKIKSVWDGLKLNERIKELKLTGLNTFECFKYVKIQDICGLPMELKLNLRWLNGEDKIK